MKKRIKVLWAALFFALAAFFTGCSKESAALLRIAQNAGDVDTYNTDLFYRNNVTIFSADPSVLYVDAADDPVNGGYFYLYQSPRDILYISDPYYDETFDAYGNYQIKVKRSKDMVDWEDAGPVNGMCLFYSQSSWMNRSVWGVEVYFNRYDAAINPTGDNKYYLYFAADSKVNTGDKEYSSSTNFYDRFYIGIACSETPYGPFALLTSADYYGSEGATNQNGKVITEETPPINFTLAYGLTTKAGNEGSFGCIDPQLFRDPVTGKAYLYFTRQMASTEDTAAYVGEYGNNSVWGMEMKDLLTPDYSTLTLLALPGYETVDASGRDSENPCLGYEGTTQALDEAGSVVNEGSFTLYHEGKYYLTYAKTGNGHRNYDQKQAVSDSPLGPFVKISGDYAVFGANSYNDYAAGLGHNTYFQVGDELWGVYGKFADTSVGVSSGRVTAFDRVSWVRVEGYDYDLLLANGPTMALQPKAAAVTGYKNIAQAATVSVSSKAAYSGTAYLTDSLIPTGEALWDYEFCTDDRVEITLRFNQPKTVRSVLVYNSADYYYAFDSIENIRFALSEIPAWYQAISPHWNGSVFETGRIAYPEAYVNREEEFMRQGGAAVAEFNEIRVTEIKIAVSTKYVTKDGNEDLPQIRIGEIVVLGRE